MPRTFLLLLCLPLQALSQSGDPARLVETGQASFERNCASCHGTDAGGAGMGPNLIAARRLRAQTAAQIRNFIAKGSPSNGMPAFPLPAPELEALAAFVRSLNTSASEAPMSGSVDAGRAFYLGKGKCDTCHMVRGTGSALGPDLSNVAKELTAGEIRQILGNPAARITPGYRLVTAHLKDGGSVRGFVRGRNSFDTQIQTLDGQFRFLPREEIASVQPERSLMPAVTGTREELRDLAAYLSTLTRDDATPFSPSKPALGAGVSFNRIRNPKPGDWVTYNGNLNGNRYSDLKQINRGNVASLSVKWMFPIDHFGLELTPLVADGVMYISGPNQAMALDALTGRQLWKYARPRTPGLIGDASLGTNRGVCLLGDKVFLSMDNAHLIALNRTTGALVWDQYMPEEAMHYGSTVAPLPVGDDTVIAGVSGGDRGMRGFLAAYKASTGERLWRLWTIPKKGEPGSETWGDKEPVTGGGATWLTGAYDPESKTLYWPTGNPWPDSDDRERPGDNLYSNCILAIDPATGKMKWHFQFTPHDVHDWDATEPPLLVDTLWGGKPRKLLLHADRNGFFYVLDRVDGKLLLAKQFIKNQTWTQGIAADGRPLPPPAVQSPLDCPSDAANWNSAAFSPVSRLMYVLTLEQCKARTRLGDALLPTPQKIVRAIAIDTGRVEWEIPFEGVAVQKAWPGILATAGGAVFFSDPNGTFAAADEKTGKILWRYPTNVLMKASPMTFTAQGKQFIATVAGPNIVCFGLE